MTRPEDVPWWHDAVVYEIYIRSFADSDGDGVGDLPGIRSKLPYLAQLGVDAIWITPFYRSPMHDHGYDVADYCDIDPMFGALQDLDELLTDAHRLGLRVLVDIVPNHTSNEHPWFVDAISSPTSAKRDWYMFRPPKGVDADGAPIPPNNWTSVFGGPAWTFDEASGEFYLHLFDSSQPDLNWRNPKVHEAFHEVLRFWFDRGVDGFRIDVAHGLYKDAQLRDNVKPRKGPAGTEHLQSVGAGNCWDQPETIDVWREWRAVSDDYDDRMFVGEVFLYDIDRVAEYVGTDRLHQAFNFTVAGTPFDAKQLAWTVQHSLDAFLREGTTPTWVLSNHDLERHVTRFGGGDLGERRGRAATALLLALPGSPYLYQGEELGLEQSDVPEAARQDPIWFRSHKVGRDGCRTPMPWTAAGPGHGFTTGTPWLPFDEQARTRNVEAEQAASSSPLAFYGEALRVRRALRPALGFELTWLATEDDVLAFSRTLSNGDRLVLVTVTGNDKRSIDVGGSVQAQLLTSGADAEFDGSTVVVAPCTTVWLRVEATDVP